jgi:hypothetical protein
MVTAGFDGFTGWEAAMRRNRSAKATCSGVGSLGSQHLLKTGRLASRTAVARECHAAAAALVLE